MGWGDGYPAWWDAAPAPVRAVLGGEYVARARVAEALASVRPEAHDDAPVVWCRWPTRADWVAWRKEQGLDVAESARVWRKAYSAAEVTRAAAEVRAEREAERGDGWLVPVSERPCWRVYVEAATVGESGSASLCRRATVGGVPRWVPTGMSASYGPCVAGLAARQADCMRVTDARWYVGERASDGRVGWCQRRCRSRCCPVCLRASASRRAATYGEVGAALNEAPGVAPWFLTLTQRAYVGETLASALARLRHAWSRLRRDRATRARWATVVAGVSGMEATAAAADGTRRWHVHLHLAVWLDASADVSEWRAWLARAWAERAEVDGGESADPWGRVERRVASPTGGVDVRAATAAELRYTLKYAGKPADMDAEQLAEWALCTAGLRLHLPLAGLHPSGGLAKRWRAGEAPAGAVETAIFGHFDRLQAAKGRDEAPLLEVWEAAPDGRPLDLECLVCPAADRLVQWSTAAGGLAAEVVDPVEQCVVGGRLVVWPGAVSHGGLGRAPAHEVDARARARVRRAVGRGAALDAGGRWVPLRPRHVRAHSGSGEVLVRAGGDDGWGSDMVLSVARKRLGAGLQVSVPAELVRSVETLLAKNKRASMR